MPTLDSDDQTFDSGAITWDNSDDTVSVVGTQADIVNRLQQLMPQGWFTPGESPILDGLLSGVANAFSAIYLALAYVRNQTRLATMTGGFLDLFAWDFFGSDLYRTTGQSDASFYGRIQASLFREKCTRNAVIRVLTQLTGIAPLVFEPSRPLDTGVYDGPGLAYDVVGGYGGSMPYQSFVTAFRPPGQGVANVAGYDISVGGYDRASQLEYISLDMTNGVTDADIFAAIEGVRPCAYIIWARIENPPVS